MGAVTDESAVERPARTAAGADYVAGRLGVRGALVGLLGLWVLFGLLNPRFLSAVNLTNLALQVVALGTIAVAVVLVLLIGEIDLSVGAVSGFGAAVMAVLNVKGGWPAVAAIVAGLAVGLLVGVLHGVLVTRVGIPSFVVTLAGLLGWQGALLVVLGDTGTINLIDPTLVGIAGTFLPPVGGWVVVTAVLVTVGASRLRPGSRGAAPRGALLEVVAIAVVAYGVVAVFNLDRGIPTAVLVFLVLVVTFDLLMRRTRFGRHAIAIGSNPDVARRVGIDVDRVRLGIFALTSSLAVAGGILAASRLLAVNQSSGSTDLMLGAVAAAVIGGTSLFGGRGSVWSALLGALVIGTVGNGLDLLGVSPAIRSVATGVVLALAVGVEAVARRSGGARHAPGPSALSLSFWSSQHRR